MRPRAVFITLIPCQITEYFTVSASGVGYRECMPTDAGPRSRMQCPHTAGGADPPRAAIGSQDFQKHSRCGVFLEANMADQRAAAAGTSAARANQGGGVPGVARMRWEGRLEVVKGPGLPLAGWGRRGGGASLVSAVAWLVTLGFARAPNFAISKSACRPPAPEPDRDTSTHLRCRSRTTYFGPALSYDPPSRSLASSAPRPACCLQFATVHPALLPEPLPDPLFTA